MSSPVQEFPGLQRLMAPHPAAVSVAMTIPAQPFAKPVLSGTHAEVGTPFRFLSEAFAPGGGKAWACLEEKPVLSTGTQAIFLLEERRQIWATKCDRGCVGSSLSFGGTAVLFVKVTAEVAWSGEAGRREPGSSSAERVLELCFSPHLSSHKPACFLSC